MSEWTVETLKEHHDGKIEAVERELRDGFVSRDKTVAALEASIAKSLADRNEIQKAMKDAAESNEKTTYSLTATFMPRSEATSSMMRNAEDIKALEARVNRSEGRGGGTAASWVWVGAALGLLFNGALALIALAALWLSMKH